MCFILWLAHLLSGYLKKRKSDLFYFFIQPEIGSTMPLHFSSTYTPINDPGTPNQIRRVARMLATQMTAAGIGPGAEKFGLIPKRVSYILCSLLLSVVLYFESVLFILGKM